MRNRVRPQKKKWKKRGTMLLLFFLLFFCGLYVTQRFVAHRNGYFVPDYERVTLTPETDYDTFFMQTGLGKSAIDKLISAGEFDTILYIQDRFFEPPKVKCEHVLGWLIQEDRFDEAAVPLVDIQPGDMLVTLSSHTAGWRHGHAGLAVDENTTLEAMVVGTASSLNPVSKWTTCSDFAVLRIKGVTQIQQNEAAAYAMNFLVGVPYRLSAGFIGAKAPETEKPYFGVYCSYLVWYIWQHFGYDLDYDGGRLVSTYDLLHSPQIEVVQLYGMNPKEFIMGIL